MRGVKIRIYGTVPLPVQSTIILTYNQLAEANVVFYVLTDSK